MWWQGKGRSTQRGSTLGSTDGMESCLHGQNRHGQNIHVTFICEGLHSQSSRRYRVGTPAECLEQVCLLFGPALYISRPRPLQPQSPRARIAATTCHIRSHVYMWWSCVGCCYMYLHPSPLMSPFFVGLTKLTLVTARDFSRDRIQPRPTCRPRH